MFREGHKEHMAGKGSFEKEAAKTQNEARLERCKGQMAAV
jgi:hypothetical protein